MDKASKWIINLLMGTREEKGKKTGPSVQAETCNLGTPIVMSPMNTAKVRRRWSFKRSTSTKATNHKISRSLDSIPVTKQALLEYHCHQNSEIPLWLSVHAAATKIQAVYRSYLARRALRALRALVKLQALARGYLVRKQMNIVLRSMHAVMAIQVRARIHRIQMAEEQPIVMGRRKPYSEASVRQLKKEISENIADGNSLPAASGGLRCRSGHIDHIMAERLEHGSRICSSVHLSASQREHQLKMCPSPSTLSFTDSSCTTYDGPLEEFSLKMAKRSFRHYSPFIRPPAQGPDYMPSSSHFIPNYITNTKSSKAKARSHSEPRQRPKSGTKQKSRRSSSMDGKNDKDNQYPWLSKLYRCDKSRKDGECDSNISAMTRSSKHIPFEPPMNLY